MKSDLSPSATPSRLTEKELTYSMRLHGRILILRERLRGSKLRDNQEITKELHALEWAVKKISEIQATPSETATPYAYEYVDKEGVETFTFQPPDRLKDAHEYKCTPLYKAPVSATRRIEDPHAKFAYGTREEPHDKNGAPRRGDGLKLYASIFREFFPNHQGEIELSAAVLEEMAERISLAWTTPSATRLNDELRAAWESRDKWQAEAERLAVELRGTR